MRRWHSHQTQPQGRSREARNQSIKNYSRGKVTTKTSMSKPNYSEEEEEMNRRLNGYAGVIVGIWVFLMVVLPLIKWITEQLQII